MERQAARAVAHTVVAAARVATLMAVEDHVVAAAARAAVVAADKNDQENVLYVSSGNCAMSSRAVQDVLVLRAVL